MNSLYFNGLIILFINSIRFGGGEGGGKENLSIKRSIRAFLSLFFAHSLVESQGQQHRTRINAAFTFKLRLRSLHHRIASLMVLQCFRHPAGEFLDVLAKARMELTVLDEEDDRKMIEGCCTEVNNRHNGGAILVYDTDTVVPLLQNGIVLELDDAILVCSFSTLALLLLLAFLLDSLPKPLLIRLPVFLLRLLFAPTLALAPARGTIRNVVIGPMTYLKHINNDTV